MASRPGEGRGRAPGRLRRQRNQRLALRHGRSPAAGRGSEGKRRAPGLRDPAGPGSEDPAWPTAWGRERGRGEGPGRKRAGAASAAAPLTGPVPAAEEAAAAGARHSKWRRRGRSTDTAGGGIRAPARSPRPPGLRRPRAGGRAAAASAGTAARRRGTSGGAAGKGCSHYFSPAEAPAGPGLGKERCVCTVAVTDDVTRGAVPRRQRSPVARPGGSRRPQPGFRRAGRPAAGPGRRRW